MPSEPSIRPCFFTLPHLIFSLSSTATHPLSSMMYVVCFLSYSFVYLLTGHIISPCFFLALSLSLVCRPRKKIRANQIVASVSPNHASLVFCPPAMDDKRQETRAVVNKALVRVSVCCPGRQIDWPLASSIFFLFGRKVQVYAMLWMGDGWMSGACESRE